MWSLADGTCLRTLEGHTSSVLALSFVSAGTQLLSTGSDGLLKLWSVKTSECLNTFDEHEDKVWALAAADDGAKVYTGTFQELSRDAVFQTALGTRMFAGGPNHVSIQAPSSKFQP